MKKITDRFWLGAIAGLGGNIVKTAVEYGLNKSGFSKSNGRSTAAGIFLKKADIAKPYGKSLGIIADNMIAMGLGVTCIYWLTLMGKDKYLLKGAGLGAMEWGGLYGVLSRLGATEIYPVSPKDGIAEFISHMAFGASKIAIAVGLGDERLFKPDNLKIEIKEPQNLFPQYSEKNRVDYKDHWIEEF